MEKGPQPITNAHALFFSAIIWLTTTEKKGKTAKESNRRETTNSAGEEGSIERGAYTSRNGSLKRNVEPRPRFLPGISSYFPAPFAREIAV